MGPVDGKQLHLGHSRSSKPVGTWQVLMLDTISGMTQAKKPVNSDSCPAHQQQVVVVEVVGEARLGPASPGAGAHGSTWCQTVWSETSVLTPSHGGRSGGERSLATPDRGGE
ncbi:hypothetical protein RRG08_047123 [Elysia crispata]|uniref:Uncharacterized protein n=1 Tax=Elysia crispata TaxID=231223 RepID=A0AAE1AP77_9GAST|nr:hypothetical protein RRG08_047123 [Elysia crispata]